LLKEQAKVAGSSAAKVKVAVVVATVPDGPPVMDVWGAVTSAGGTTVERRTTRPLDRLARATSPMPSPLRSPTARPLGR
jgi:hypothetical protein